VKIHPATIRHLREDRGLGLTALAATAGISHGHLSDIESGRRDPSPVVADSLAQALGVTVADLRGPIVCPNCGYALP
jgi:XRE family transcriptional regulator, regulator of sulfur utilization